MRLALALLPLACGCDILAELPEIHTLDAPALPSGLVAYYPMDVLGPSLADCLHDAAGTHDGACTTTAPTITPGKVGGAYSFDGTIAITVPYSADLDLVNGFTVAFWLHLAAPLASLETDCPVNRVLGTLDGNTWQICPLDGAILFVAGAALTASVTVDATSWHHFAVTWDGTAMAGYYDALKVVTQVTTVQFDNHGMVLGMDLDGGVPVVPFHGLLDELRIYGRALATEEIRLLATP